MGQWNRIQGCQIEGRVLALGPRLAEEDRRCLLEDRLVASYPAVAKAIDQPTDFIERIKQQMRRYYRSEDI